MPGVRQTTTGVVDTTSGVASTSAIPDSVVEDFERTSPLDDYGGDTGSFSVQQTDVYEGDDALLGSSTGIIASTSGLPSYPSQGEIFSARVAAAGGNDVSLGYAAQSESGSSSFSGYTLAVDFSSNNLTLRRWDNGTPTTLSQVNTDSLSTDTWYEPRVEWGTDDSHICELSDTDGSLVNENATSVSNQISVTDGNYTSGGAAWRNGGAGSADVYGDYYIVREQI